MSRATVYRAFPGGRDELIDAVVSWATLEFFARLYEQVQGADEPRGGDGAGHHVRPPVHRRARRAAAGDADRAGEAAARP